MQRVSSARAGYKSGGQAGATPTPTPTNCRLPNSARAPRPIGHRSPDPLLRPTNWPRMRGMRTAHACAACERECPSVQWPSRS
eukprot:scaffold4863_cov57-Phaeocystis_antarctica.AAC.3